jgi:hypothetical protein
VTTTGLDRPVPIETPFLEVWTGPDRQLPPTPAADEAETPFLSEYLVGGEVVGGTAEGFRELLADLHDREFDEAVAELVDEADARAQLLGANEATADSARVERALGQWIEPLRLEAEELLLQMATGLGDSLPQSLTEDEVDERLAHLEPSGSVGGPVFEDFLKKLWRKAKGAVKGAVRLAKKGVAAVGKVLPIGAILRQLKGLVRPLLTRVLKLAMNKLPAALRPAAAELAKRFLGLGEMEAENEAEAASSAVPASGDVRLLQGELDTEIATLLLVPAEPELEALVAEAQLDAESLDDGSLHELDLARQEFVDRLAALGEGEDPTPLVEQFLPAVLPALRVGIGLIGRPRVVGFLAKLLGRLIAPVVGPQMTAPLSRAIVDAGLGLLTLETGEPEHEADPRLAAEAFASLVEDTAARVAELDEDELEDEGVVEEVALEAFTGAARAHFPGRVLRGGAGRAGGVWLTMPRGGRPRYRKYSRVMEVTVPPEAAALVMIRGGRTLEAFLRDRLGRTGPVRARLHLYQAVPGTRPGRIVRAERGVAGLGPGAVGATAELHPLTTRAAGALLGLPELGEDVEEAFLDELGPLAVGQRLYYLEVAGSRPAPAAPGAAGRPRQSSVTAAVDLPRQELRIGVYLSEARGQELAGRVRRGQPLGAVLGTLRPVYASALQALGTPAGRHGLRVVGEAGPDGSAEQLLALPGLPTPAGALGTLLARWTRRALAATLPSRRQAVLDAVAAPEDGVTLLVRLQDPAGLATLARLTRSRSPMLPAPAAWQALLRAGPGRTELDVVAGYRRA